MALFNFINLGGPVNWILFAIFLYCFCLCLERTIYFIQTNKRSEKNQLKRLQQKILEHNSTFPEEAPEEKEKFLEKESTLLYYEMNRGLWILNFISAIAPSLGLLGTVTGLIKAFQGMAGAGAQVNIQDLSGGIWEAMLTTAVGMVISIPSLFFYRTFKRIIEKRVMEMSLYAEDGKSVEEKK